MAQKRSNPKPRSAKAKDLRGAAAVYRQAQRKTAKKTKSGQYTRQDAEKYKKLADHYKAQAERNPASADDINRTKLRLKQDFLLMLTSMRNMPESMRLSENAPVTLKDLRRYVYPEWEYLVDRQIKEFAEDSRVGIPNFQRLAETQSGRNPMSSDHVRSIVREELQRNPAPSLVGNVVGTFFPLDTMRTLGQGAANDVRRLVGNPRRRNFTITEEMENDAVVIDGRHWLKIDASKLPSSKAVVKHPGDQYSYRAGDLSGKVYIPLNGNLSSHRQRNPGETAADVFEGFHGTPATRTEVVEEKLLIDDDLAQCGPLISIRCKVVTGFTTTIKFHPDRMPDLTSSKDRNQLYATGGDQELDLDGLGFTEPEQRKALMVIGIAKQVTYFTQKGFDNFEPTDYFHDLGEETGKRPTLIYDALNKTILFAGGEYRVLNEGITN